MTGNTDQFGSFLRLKAILNAIVRRFRRVGKSRRRIRLISTNELLSAQNGQGKATGAMLYGALMMRGDLDVLNEVMACNAAHFKSIFVLDGTDDWQRSKAILSAYRNVEYYMRDDEMPSDWPRPPRDGARQALLEVIQARHGYEGFVVVLHSDEMYLDYPPALLAGAMERLHLDAMSVTNVPFFLHASRRKHYNYQPGKSVAEQVTFASFPGYSEFRIFRNKPGLRYEVGRHGQVIPAHGLSGFGHTAFPVRHYAYRTPEQTKGNAKDRVARAWQSYGATWLASGQDTFVECLPQYRFSKHIPPGWRITNGETGKLEHF